MASEKTLAFTIVKSFLLLLSVLMVIGSFYVGTTSSKIIAGQQQLSAKESPYSLRRLQLSVWWFITVVTLALQDFSALLGLVGAYKESYELTLTYSLITCGVLILNLVNPSLLPTVVGPIFDAIVMVVAFVFSRYLKNIRYNVASAKSKPNA